MKVVKAQEMARVEALAIAEGASEAAFMEKAGAFIAAKVRQVIARNHLKPKILLLCGKGNNGGDALVAGRLLCEGGFEVDAWLFSEAPTPYSRGFVASGGKILPPEAIPFERYAVAVDGLFGTGFHGDLPEKCKEIILKSNQSGIYTMAIDIPSGINGSTGEIKEVCIHAQETLFLGLPKTGCFLGKAWNHVGAVSVGDFGLLPKYIEMAQADFLLLEEKEILALLPPLIRTRHKYEAGYVVGIGGSPGMPGAPLLASLAALRSGAGLMRLFHPPHMQEELCNAPLEIIRQEYSLEGVRQAFKKAKALFIGPGMGTTPDAHLQLQTLLPHLTLPCVIDADALTLIASHHLPLPPHAILTPHHGEMQRLLHVEKNLPLNEFFAHCQAFAEKHAVTVVLKGAPTFIFHPETLPHLSDRGDPGMATAGTGDVLTGMITAFLAQGKPPLEAAQLGVYLHGMAGEIAARTKGSYSLMASDLIEALSAALKTSL